VLHSFYLRAWRKHSHPHRAHLEPEANPKSSVEELAKLKQNPVSGLRQVLIQAEIS
jgi:hypothetical protein